MDVRARLLVQLIGLDISKSSLLLIETFKVSSYKSMTLSRDIGVGTRLSTISNQVNLDDASGDKPREGSVIQRVSNSEPRLMKKERQF